MQCLETSSSIEDLCGFPYEMGSQGGDIQYGGLEMPFGDVKQENDAMNILSASKNTVTALVVNIGL
jgi:hypothetical protein